MSEITIPRWSTFQFSGGYFISERSILGQNNVTRNYPATIILPPRSVIKDSADCSIQDLKFREWSTTLTQYSDRINEEGCLDYIISIKITRRLNANTSILKSTVSDLLSSFSDNGVLESRINRKTKFDYLGE